ncbi:amino acid permease [Thermogemmatispora sp.]|uniref:amino acid permease n=1 Tax=Thermogemmatispora sp. TaxID=1968838 RepID=UPI001DCCA75C|nr:amino acid permease [Thermogemmatispora sp.]MBX5451231.1 amino acid permease [Thermogemmatispora sp.]
MLEPQRDVPRSLLRAGVIGVLAYAIPILLILLALPKDQLSNVGGFLDAYQAVASVSPSPLATALGWLIALALILTLASAGDTWLMGADRTYAGTALDGAAPLILGRFSARFGNAAGK